MDMGELVRATGPALAGMGVIVAIGLAAAESWMSLRGARGREDEAAATAEGQALLQERTRRLDASEGRVG